MTVMSASNLHRTNTLIAITCLVICWQETLQTLYFYTIQYQTT